MLGLFVQPLWAVHISDGILTWPWLAGGAVVAALLALAGAWRLRDEEIPQVALMAAAFFVASLAHVNVGHSNAHLLLCGLMGVVLGRRAPLAIPVGLFLQAALFGHGGLTTIGINSCIMTLPALLAWQMFAGLQRVPWVREPWFRAVLVAASTLVWTLSLVYSVTLLCTNSPTQLAVLDTGPANRFTFHPIVLAAALCLAALTAWLEGRLENAPEFPLGLLIGQTSVLATVLLACLVLLWGGQEKAYSLSLVVFVVHLPVAVVEGIVLGFAIGFLVRVKPEMVRWVASEKMACTVESLP
jgi:cobalt/nickel transport system permease protein